MTRPWLAFALFFSLLTWLPAPDARAEETPVRKPGLWEMKISRTGWPLPQMSMQHCTDATVDRDMNTGLAPAAKDVCSRHEVQKTATGYISDTVCSVAGASITSHSEVSGDFNSAYTVKSSSHTEHGPAALPPDGTMTIEARWLGACKPGQNPGDIVMPGGFKLNMKDQDMLKGVGAK